MSKKANQSSWKTGEVLMKTGEEWMETLSNPNLMKMDRKTIYRGVYFDKATSYADRIPVLEGAKIFSTPYMLQFAEGGYAYYFHPVGNSV